jgi:sugar/nucleoside kinase (ribokinase family)
MQAHHDVVAAGHNGLTCAAYLAQAGLRVAVLERRSIVGGACVTGEFPPRARLSSRASRGSSSELEQCADVLFGLGAEYVVLKKGARGCAGIARSGDRVDFEGHRVQVVDPTGAGDCFCATFVSLIASGRYSLRAALERANTAGALAVMKAGPMEGNSTLSDLESVLNTPLSAQGETDLAR